MKPLQVLSTRSPSPLLRLAGRWLPYRQARTPMGGRIIHLGAPAAATLWALAVLATTPMVLLGVATVV
jgi:hypothetical protein